MCGIFGFITNAGEGPDIRRLRRLAVITQTRGAHAFGLAWVDADGRLEAFKRPGPASDHLDELERCRDAVAMVGHCRYATHGSPLNNRNNHPHAAGSGWLVHNGVVHNHAGLAVRHGLCTRTQCDSEVLALLMAKGRGSVSQRSAWVANQAAGDLALLGLWRNPTRLLVARRGRPLHFAQARDGYYFASLAVGLPGQPQAVFDGSTRVVIYDASGLRLESDPVRLA